MTELIEGSELLQQIRDMVTERNFRSVRDALVAMRAVEVADLIHELSGEEKALVFRILPRDLATETFEHLDTVDQKDLLETLGTTRFAVLLNEMAADDRTALLEELPARAVRQVVSLLSKEQREEALALLGYPENSVGRLMVPDYIAVSESWTIAQTLDYIRHSASDEDACHVLYVVDEAGVLIDDLPIRSVLLASPEKRISDLMNRSFVALRVYDDQEAAVQTFKKYDRSVLPVVDDNNNMLGLVTVDDMLDVAEEEATEDILKLGGVEALSDPYMKTPLRELIRRRGTWLIVLFIGEMLTASAMSFYEQEIQRAIVLALFIPLIISSGGNSGSQAATLIIRALAIGEISLRDWYRVMRREIISGFFLGLILGVIGFLRIAVWSQFADVYGPHWFGVALTVGFSLLGVVMWGVLSGAMLPFFLKRVGLDPATSSAPFVATLVDVTGLVLYFSIAAFVLGGTLL